MSTKKNKIEKKIVEDRGFTSGFIAGFRVITSRGRFITRRTTPAESIFILNNEKKITFDNFFVP
jgi:hypothetical protein